MILLILSNLAAAAPSGHSVPTFDVSRFFSGRTHAENKLRIIFHRPATLVVDTVGHRQGEEFIQTDRVQEGDKPVRIRVWRTHQIAPNHFGGTLSDATGPVDITVQGGRVVIRYTMEGGLDILETLDAQQDGKRLSNHVIAKKFGMIIAHVDGSIRKLD